MKRDLIEILKGFGNYLGEGVVVSGIGILSVPILTRAMSVSEYGEFNVILSYVSIASVLFVLNVHSSVGRYFYEKTEDFGTFLCAVIVFSMLLFSISSFFFFQYFNHSYFLSSMVVILTAFAIIESIYRQIFQAQLKSRDIAITGILKAVLVFCLIIFSIFYLGKDGYEVPLYSRSIGGAVFFIYFLLAITKYFSIGLKFSHFKYFFSYSFPLIPYALSSIILSHFDRIMIMELAGNEDAGLYSFAYNIGFIMSLIIGALNSGFYPVFFKNYSEGDFVNHDVSLYKTQNIVIISFLFFILFYEEIGLILGPDRYSESLPVVPIVVLGYVFYSFFCIYNRNFDFAKKTYLSTAVIFTAGVFNIALNYLYIPMYGYISAAYTTLASYMLLALLSWSASIFMLKIHSASFWLLLKPLVIISPLVLLDVYIKGLNSNEPITFCLDLLILAVGIFLVFPNFFTIVKRLGIKIS